MATKIPNYDKAEASTDSFLVKIVKSKWSLVIVAAYTVACLYVGSQIW